MFKRILKALLALFFGQLLTRFGSFILVPLFTKHWTPTVYGEWLTLSATVAYIATLDLGVNQAAINKLTECYATGKTEEYKSIQHSSLKLFIAVAVIGIIIFSIILGFIPIRRWLGITITSPTEASYTLLLLGAYILISLPARMVFSIYQTTGNLAKTQWIQNAQSIFFLVFGALLLVNGFGMIYLALIQFLLQALAILYVLIDTKITLPTIYPGIKYASNGVIKDLFKPGLLFTFIVVANIIWYQGSILLISTIYGGLLVATFSVTRTLALLPRQIVSIFYSALFPDIAILKGKNDNDRLRMLHRLIIIIPVGLAILFFSLFWFHGKEIISVWTMGEIKPDINLLYALLFLVLSQTAYLSSATITLATNLHQTFTILFFCSQLFGFIMSLTLINSFGVLAVPLSFLLGELIFCNYFIIKDTCKKINENYRKLFLSVSFNTIVLVIITMFIQFIILRISNFSSLTNILVAISVNAFICFIYIWFVWLKNDEKDFLSDQIINTFKRV